jgi:hypothetical protein
MAWSLVQQGAQTFADAATTASFSLGGFTAGNFALALCSLRCDTASFVIPTPSGWSVCEAPTAPSGTIFFPNVGIFYKENSAGGTETANFGTLPGSAGNNFMECTILEFSGIVTSGSLGSTAHTSQTSNGGTTADSGTTSGSAVAGDLVAYVGCVQEFNSSNTGITSPPTGGTTWTATDSGVDCQNHVSYSSGYKSAAAGTQQGQTTFTNNNSWVAAIGFFTAATTVPNLSGSFKPWQGPKFFRSPKKRLNISTSSDVNVSLSGVTSSGSVGLTSVAVDKGLTGVSSTGSVGNLAAAVSAALTAISAIGSVGNLSAAIDIALTALSSSGSVGTLVPAISVALSGVSATGSVGTVTASTGYFIALTGVSATGSVGTLGVNVDKTLDNLSAVASVGTPIANTNTTIAGLSSPGSVGALIVSVDKSLVGISVTGSINGVTANVSVGVGGLSAAGSVGTVTASTGDVTVALTGVTSTSSVGSLGVNVTLNLSGIIASGTVGTVSIPGANVGTAVAAWNSVAGFQSVAQQYIANIPF